MAMAENTIRPQYPFKTREEIRAMWLRLDPAWADAPEALERMVEADFAGQKSASYEYGCLRLHPDSTKPKT